MKWKRAKNSELPDADPETPNNSVDPFGNDYVCKICFHELSNTYFHCIGCETIMSKDFNICIKCFREESYLVNIEMSPPNVYPMASHYHHFGDPKARCCHLLSTCLECAVCQKCSFCLCVCHKSFQRRCRFFSTADKEEMLENCARVIEGNDVKYSIETLHRLRGEVMIPIQADVSEIVADNGKVTGEVKEDDVLQLLGVEMNEVDNGSCDVLECAVSSTKKQRANSIEPVCPVILLDSI
jgi:hypothetical protein